MRRGPGWSTPSRSSTDRGHECGKWARRASAASGRSAANLHARLAFDQADGLEVVGRLAQRRAGPADQLAGAGRAAAPPLRSPSASSARDADVLVQQRQPEGAGPGPGEHPLGDQRLAHERAAAGGVDHLERRAAPTRRPSPAPPAPRPRARMFSARSALLTALSASPAPTGPTCSIRLPNAPSTGRARSKVRLVRTHHDRERPGLGAVGAAAHRRVGEGDAPLGEARGDPPRAGRIARGAVDEQRARGEGPRGGRRAPPSSASTSREVGRQVSDDVRRRPRPPAASPRTAAPCALGEASARVRGPVPHGEPAAAREVRRHRRADGAEAEEGGRPEGHVGIRRRRLGCRRSSAGPARGRA